MNCLGLKRQLRFQHYVICKYVALELRVESTQAQSWNVLAKEALNVINKTRVVWVLIVLKNWTS